MRKKILFTFPLLIYCILQFFDAQANDINPHIMADCESCHSQTPDEQKAQKGHSFLVKSSIDETCGVCHERYLKKDMYEIHGHPTGIKNGPKQNQPRNLPLSNGYITCNTCHLMVVSQNDPTPYRLRVDCETVSANGDWSNLCRECHAGY